MQDNDTGPHGTPTTGLPRPTAPPPPLKWLTAAFQGGRPERLPVAVAQVDRERGGPPVDLDLAEVLEPGGRRRVGHRRRVHEDGLRPERSVERVRPEGAGVSGPGDELPERREV